ncbi:MAG: ABC transporter substrate-binding protein, partial [Candidatus Dormibacteria bacterium]
MKIASGRWSVAGTALVASLLVAACAPAAPSAGGSSTVADATVTFAQAVGNIPNYIFPISAVNAYASGNLSFLQPLLFRPLYWLGTGSSPVLNPNLSLANPPTYSNGGRTVNITLKHYMWSDGTPVTSRDVQFFLNMLRAGKQNWGGYAPGDIPDNIVSFAIKGTYSFSITFNNAYSPEWLLNNELPVIVPMPQQAWDKTSTGGAVGNYDLTPAGATAVYNSLNHQSLSLSTYATNPLWQVVDGPFRLSAYNATTNYVAFVPNKSYSGPNKPKIGHLIEMPFTSNAAEFNALRSGQVDYGYLPVTDLSQRSYFASHGYTVQPWPGYGINYLTINWSNPSVRPLFEQLYIRQALQLLVDQPLWIKDIFKGYAYPVDGPVPLVPKTPFVSTLEQKNPYPFNPKRAANLIAAHGWKVGPAGVALCERPGSASNECGAGIAAGTPLAFNALFPAGVQAFTAEWEVWKSNASRIGINLTVIPTPLPGMGVSVPCTAGAPCTKDMVNWEGWGYGSAYPDGSETFSPAETGGYNSPTNNANINATHLSSNPNAMFR